MVSWASRVRGAAPYNSSLCGGHSKYSLGAECSPKGTHDRYCGHLLGNSDLDPEGVLELPVDPLTLAVGLEEVCGRGGDVVDQQQGLADISPQ